MWKKEDEQQQPAASPITAGVGSRPEIPIRSTGPAAGQAIIGQSITIRGDVTGDEDLFIQGRIEGTVDLKQHSVTVGPEGRVKANISGRTVTVQGEVDGDVRGQEQVSLRSTSKVNGDIVAPRVVLEDGATFLGSIDMSGKTKPAEPPKPVPLPAIRDSSGKVTANPPTGDQTSAAKA